VAPRPRLRPAGAAGAPEISPGRLILLLEQSAGPPCLSWVKAGDGLNFRLIARGQVEGQKTFFARKLWQTIERL
jgi:hypothetical protein